MLKPIRPLSTRRIFKDAKPPTTAPKSGNLWIDHVNHKGHVWEPEQGNPKNRLKRYKWRLLYDDIRG